MNDWQNHPEIDPVIVQALVGAVGVETFADMREQFATDLRSLAEAYQKSYADGAYDQARAQAHALKGAAANIGLVQLSVLAGEFEREASDPGTDLAAILDRSLVKLEAAT
ncbi:Hpt domain-containing protein [Maricaulis sp.]|uniref:Hpt domain-containing protein n=1 Tax=Maricaulis sp. TaxID=1486257 RepID=UPI0025C6BE45|nr:Hpt domain-containing protein [Maricaulis sp.]